jgi:beta-glucosidase
MSAEAGSRAFLSLPENQMELLRRLAVLGKPVIVVLLSGRPLALDEVSSNCDALLQAWFPGTEGGNAIADILTGTKKPSGRLTISFPHSVGQLPLYYNHLPTGRPQDDSSANNRFASGYIDSPNAPLYPFGYGLTYTTFDYSNVTLSKTAITPDETIQASIHLKNTGKYLGTETVQLYLRDMAGTYSRPVRMLKDFRQVTLLPGEETDITFTIGRDQLEYYIPAFGVVLEPGEFAVFIGPDSSTTNQLSFILKSE